MISLPPAASSAASAFDALFITETIVTASVAVGVFAALLYFGIRYRAGSNAPRHEDMPAAQTRVRRRLETAWIVIPALLFCAAFAWGARLYVARASPPADALRIYVVAKQWMWTAQHPGGQREINELHVPRGQPVLLVMTSQDVIHSFFVPAFRAKQDVLPGRYTELWFTPIASGRFHLFCVEYCGTDHARMGGEVIVLEPAEFERWLGAHAGPQDAAAHGEVLFRQYGCSGCHGENAAVHAPDLAGIFGKPVPLADGTTVMADERYVRDSILLPQKEIAAGYPTIMPSFAGRIGEADIFDLIAYIRGLAPATERPR